MEFSDIRGDQRPTEAELPAIAEHVTYEADMFFYTVERVHRFDRDGFRDFREHNAIVESMLVHQRNLTDFFAGPFIKDDAAALDYTEWNPEGEVEDSLMWLKEQRGPIHKFLTHVTATRTDDALRAKVQDGRRYVAPHVATVWAAFLGGLPSDRRPWFAG